MIDFQPIDFDYPLFWDDGYRHSPWYVLHKLVLNDTYARLVIYHSLYPEVGGNPIDDLTDVISNRLDEIPMPF